MGTAACLPSRAMQRSPDWGLDNGAYQQHATEGCEDAHNSVLTTHLWRRMVPANRRSAACSPLGRRPGCANSSAIVEEER